MTGDWCVCAARSGVATAISSVTSTVDAGTAKDTIKGCGVLDTWPGSRLIREAGNAACAGEQREERRRQVAQEEEEETKALTENTPRPFAPVKT